MLGASVCCAPGCNAIMSAMFYVICSLLMFACDASDDHGGGPRRHSLYEVGLLQTSAQIVSTQSLSQRWGPDAVFWGKPAIVPCRLAGSAHHKSGGRRRVKSWPEDIHKQTHSSQLDL